MPNQINNHYHLVQTAAHNIHRVRKIRANSISGITPSNTYRFSNPFHFHNPLEIRNKAVIKYSIAPKTRHYTTL